MPPPGSSVEELQNIWFDTSRPAAERAAAAEEVWNRTGARLAEPKPKAPPPLGMTLLGADRKPVAPAVNTLPAPADPGTEQIAPAMPIEEFVAAQGGSTVSPIPKAAPVAQLVQQAYGAPAPASDPAAVYGAEAPKPGIVIPEQTVAGSPTGPITPVPGVTVPVGGWRPRTEKPAVGAPAWLTRAVTPDFAETEASRDEQTVADVDPNAARDLRLDRYAGEAAAQARDFKLFPSTVTPQEAGELRDIAERQAQNVADTFEAQEYARQAVQRAAKAAQDKQDAIDAENILREQERQRQLLSAEQSYREMADENLKEPIDSERSWNRKGTGEKLLARIGLFLGTLGSGVSGTPNIAWQSMQNDIDRDIEAQKANKALMGNRLAAEGSLIGMARDRFASEAAADAAARASAYARIQAELGRFAESAKTPERKAALDGLMLEADKARLGQEQALRTALQSDEYKRRAEMARRAAMGGPKSLMQKAKEEAQFTKYRAETAKNLREMRGDTPEAKKFEVPGYGYARDRIEAKELRDLLAQHEANMANLDRAERLMKEGSAKVGAFGVGTDKYQEALALKTQIVTDIAKSYGGVITDADREAAILEVPDPTSWKPGASPARLKAARQKLNTKLAAHIRSKVDGAPPKFEPKTETK